MSEIDLRSSVGRWVAEYPQVAEVFETFRIDYGCDGDQTVEEACWKNGLETLRVQSRLERVVAALADDETQDWLHAPVSQLCQHLTHTHHALLKRELPRLAQLIADVVADHRETHPELLELQQTFLAMCDQMLMHTDIQEEVVFPAIVALERQEGARLRIAIDLRRACDAMHQQHQAIGQRLWEVRQTMHDFARPADACPRYRQMLQTLKRIERDTHDHIHKETYILAPRVAALTRRRKACERSSS